MDYWHSKIQMKLLQGTPRPFPCEAMTREGTRFSYTEASEHPISAGTRAALPDLELVHSGDASQVVMLRYADGVLSRSGRDAGLKSLEGTAFENDGFEIPFETILRR